MRAQCCLNMCVCVPLISNFNFCNRQLIFTEPVKEKCATRHPTHSTWHMICQVTITNMVTMATLNLHSIYFLHTQSVLVFLLPATSKHKSKCNANRSIGLQIYAELQKDFEFCSELLVTHCFDELHIQRVVLNATPTTLHHL